VSDVIAPLGALFRHANGREPDLDEILILSFNHDLAFFERAILGPAQLTGARVTIVADAAMAHHDVYAVRRAGTAYLPGLARCRGSFHPKLLVLASEGRATVGVGSGNLSMAGWQGNDELWSWHHATAGEGSAVVAQAGGWLRALAASASVAVGRQAAEALRRVGALLAGLNGDDGSCRLVETLTAPVLDQLPVGPVDELNVYAPFYDPNAAALSALVDRLRPAKVRVAYQPSQTRINGAAVAALDPDEVRELPEARYRHGKLIEWAVGGARWALTGSANISAAALLKTVPGGGNVELGVIAPVEQSLFPDGVAATRSHLATVQYRGMAPTTGPPTLILAATRTRDGVELELVRPLPSAGRVELSEADWPPDRWHPVLEAHAGHADLLIPDAPGGSRVRLRLADGSVSAVAWVVDPRRVQQTRAATRSGPKPPDLSDVFADVGAAEKFFELNLQRQQTTAPPTGHVARTGTTTSTTHDIESWEEYLDRCAGRVGAYGIAFSLGLRLPAEDDIPAGASGGNWDDDEPGGNEDRPEGDTPDQVQIEEPPRVEAPSLWKATDRVRARYRTFARRLVHDWVAPEPLERLVALRSVLLLVAGGAWDQSDEDWRPLVLDAVEKLSDGDREAEYGEAAGSLALLALSIVKGSLGRESQAITARYNQVIAHTADLLVEADHNRIGEYAQGLERRFLASSRPDIAFEVLERLTGDELDLALEDLRDKGFQVERSGRVFDLTKPVTDPVMNSVLALTAIDSVAPIAVRCSSASGAFANVLWRPPDAVVINSPKPGAVWCRHYRYPDRRRLGTDARLEGRLDNDRCVATTTVRDPLPPIAVELLEHLGLPGPLPPAC
jgi:hypothetical protein